MRILTAILALFAFTASSLGQTATSTLRDWEKAAGGPQQFEVASIHLLPPGVFKPPNFPLSNDDSYTPGPNSEFNAAFSLVAYVQFAYKLRLSPDQMKTMLAAAPKWASSDNFEIHAKAAAPVSKDQLRLMVQAMLADRFKLAIHFESHDSPVSALTLAKPGKLGPNLHPHSEGPSCDQPHPEVFPPNCYMDVRAPAGEGIIKEGSRNNSMEVISHILTAIGRQDHPLVDQTGLKGNYDFIIEWSPAASAVSVSDSAAAPPTPTGPSFLEALQEQLGMKIVASHAPIEFIVIDHAERPSEN